MEIVDAEENNDYQDGDSIWLLNPDRSYRVPELWRIVDEGDVEMSGMFQNSNLRNIQMYRSSRPRMAC
jgi:hypothetical protein